MAPIRLSSLLNQAELKIPAPLSSLCLVSLLALGLLMPAQADAKAKSDDDAPDVVIKTNFAKVQKLAIQKSEEGEKLSSIQKKIVEKAEAEEDARAEAKAKAAAVAREAKAKADAQARAEAKAEAEEEARAEAKAEAKAKAAALAREAKAKAEALARAEAKAEAEEEARAEAKAEAKAKAATLAREAKAKAEALARAEAKAQAEEEARAEAKAKATTLAREAKAKADAQARAEAVEAEAKANEERARLLALAKIEAKQKAEAQARAEAKAAQEAKVAADASKARSEATERERLAQAERERAEAQRVADANKAAEDKRVFAAKAAETEQAAKLAQLQAQQQAQAKARQQAEEQAQAQARAKQAEIEAKAQAVLRERELVAQREHELARQRGQALLREREAVEAREQETARQRGQAYLREREAEISRQQGVQVAAQAPIRLAQLNNNAGQPTSDVQPNIYQQINYAAPPTVRSGRGSVGAQLGLRGSADELGLSSSVAYVMDQDSGEVLLSKNESAVLPIASITKMMTALVVRESRLPMDEILTVSPEDTYSLRGTSSRLRMGDSLTRAEFLHLMLMSSENLAAHLIARNYPGGFGAFIEAMNAKARQLGMRETFYQDSSGLSSSNQSSARDLSILLRTAYKDSLLREYSTWPGYEIMIGNRVLKFNNTNALVQRDGWQIGIQKTGYISAAGRCLMMQAKVGGRNLIMVFLDAAGKAARIGDAERVRMWVENMMGYKSYVPTTMMRQSDDSSAALSANLDWKPNFNTEFVSQQVALNVEQ